MGETVLIYTTWPDAETAERVGAEHDSHRKALACLLVLLVLDAPVLARHHVDGDVFRIEHLHAIGADIHPVGVEVARDHRASGADVAPAVHLVPQRRREPEQVDLALHVLERRAGLHHFRLEFVHETAEQVIQITRAFQDNLSGKLPTRELTRQLQRFAPQGATEGSLFVPDNYLALPLLQ